MARVLVIDSNPQTLQTLVRMVRALGHEALEASSAHTAAAIAGASNPDVAIVDLEVPGAAEQPLAADLWSAHSTTSIIVMGRPGIGDAQMLRAAQKAGARGILLKPIHLSDLARAIRRVTPFG